MSDIKDEEAQYRAYEETKPGTIPHTRFQQLTTLMHFMEPEVAASLARKLCGELGYPFITSLGAVVDESK